MGTCERSVILAKKAIVDLQEFLMVAASECARVRDESDERTRDLFAGSAGLDYALMLASERAYGPIDDDSDAARAIRTTITDAVRCALGALEHMLDARDGAYYAFIEERVDARGIESLLRDLCERGIAMGDDLAFRALTIASDVIERRR